MFSDIRSVILTPFTSAGGLRCLFALLWVVVIGGVWHNYLWGRAVGEYVSATTALLGMKLTTPIGIALDTLRWWHHHEAGVALSSVVTPSHLIGAALIIVGVLFAAGSE